MKRGDLPALALFAAVATRRSFRGAARDLGVSVSALSHAINGLEARLGLRLLARTTRSVAPTDAGLRLLEGLEPAFAAITEAVEAAGAVDARLSGAIRLTVPRSAAQLVLVPLVARFSRQFPQVSIELTIEDGFTNIVADGFDAGVRLGESLEQDMIAVPIGPNLRAAIVGSPDYFREFPAPIVPQDLHGHRCIQRRFAGGGLYRWEFERDGASFQVAVSGPLILNDDALIADAAVAGAGLGYAFEPAVAENLKHERLVRVLDAWCPPYARFYLYYPTRRLMRPALRAFIDFVLHERNDRP
jgi:DNA-binding transcriptional LysR family regulator